MLAATALVLLMTPGLAFYGGMIDTKTSFQPCYKAFVMGDHVLWIVDLAFWGIHRFIGNPELFMFQNVLDGKPWSLAPTIPLVLFAFQLKFANITPAHYWYLRRIRFKA
jgi:Amt family ammonium transporter